MIEYEVTDKAYGQPSMSDCTNCCMDTPDYAAIGETVEAVKQLDKGYGAGLINAMRKVQKTCRCQRN
ncbi:MAG: hypothetical protein U1E91_01865 [Moraxella sp.]